MATFHATRGFPRDHTATFHATRGFPRDHMATFHATRGFPRDALAENTQRAWFHVSGMTSYSRDRKGKNKRFNDIFIFYICLSLDVH